MKKLMVAVLCLASHVGAAQAITKDGDFVVLGSGGLGCGAFVKYPKERVTALQWVNGYLTAFNQFAPLSAGQSNVADGVNLEGRELWLENWCRTHPMSDIADAMPDMLLELVKKSKPTQ
ncbi:MULTISPECIES: hypothetical protein [Pseudomonas]|uniref:hypothetical protein n=1 Tax=Pseudomonas TaxID=286 RepID=UPI0018A8B4D5|nr:MULTISPECIES: hypothetical protein [Pseudomonas]MBF8708697.1 hypothetical protein [Pseudomonas putida]